ncbi:MAG: TylF/MycF/NovP-related O-methyltransferase [Rhizobiaceae bacterium]
MAVQKPQPEQIQSAYIDLLAKSLSYALWNEPPKLLSELPRLRSRQKILKLLDKLASLFGGRIALPYEAGEQDRLEGKIWPSQAQTMIGNYRLANVRLAVETIIRENIPGDLIETGVWRGGTCIYMRGILKAFGEQTRKVLVADSFAGLPKPDAAKYPADAGDKHFEFTNLAISRQSVADNFRKYDLLDDQVEFVEGFFEHTLHLLKNEAYSVIRLDGDMYSSTIQALEVLYPKLSVGGFCIIDDYGLAGCQKAVDDYRTKHGIKDEMIKVDWTGLYWRKS